MVVVVLEVLKRGRWGVGWGQGLGREVDSSETLLDLSL